MIDFTNCPVNRFRAYGGANGNKINITYQGHSYMLKFPPKPSRNRDMSYSNGCISEYVACHIFEMLGFRTQETLLGNYTDSRGKTKLVVACRDFSEDGKRLIEFAHLKNTCIDSEQNGYGKELSSILEAIEEQSIYPSDELRQFFWDMFIADAFLGNFDRHNGNWGFLVDEEKQQAELAPVYDCGSCLYPQLDLERMKTVLQDEAEIDQRIYSERFKIILTQQTELKAKRVELERQQAEDTELNSHMKEATDIMGQAGTAITEWNEYHIRALVASVRILSKEEILVRLKSGIEIIEKLQRET